VRKQEKIIFEKKGKNRLFKNFLISLQGEIWANTEFDTGLAYAKSEFCVVKAIKIEKCTQN